MFGFSTDVPTIVINDNFSFKNDVLPYVIVGVILAAVVYIFVIAPILLHRHNKRVEKACNEGAAVREPEFVSVGAKVVGIGEFNSYNGSPKMLKYKRLYRVAFLTDEDEELVFEVPKELHDRVSEGQHGNLITVNGNFFDFGDGEDIEE